MARRLVLDTGALIAFERGTLDCARYDDDLTIAAVTVAGFRTGTELADSAERAAGRARALATILAVTTVLDDTERTAVEHARLLAHVRLTGRPRGAHDLVVAAHAAEHGRSVVSLDAHARFGELPGVETVPA